MIDVVKIGGGQDISRSAVLDDVAELAAQGRKLIVVHGASDDIRDLGERMGEKPKSLISPTGIRSRYTDKATMDVVSLAFSRVKLDLVAYLQRRSTPAVGLTGADGAMAMARRKTALRTVENGRIRVVRDDYSAKITQINVAVIHCLLNQGFIPVLSPPALDPADGLVNVDADRFAAAVAGAVAPSRLALLTNVPGLLRDRHDLASVVEQVNPDSVEAAIALADGRMKMKVRAAQAAADFGVDFAVIADANTPRPVQAAFDGHGTVFCWQPRKDR